MVLPEIDINCRTANPISPQICRLKSHTIEVPGLSDAIRTAVGEDVGTVVFANHAGAATHIARLACMPLGMLVHCPDPIAGMETRWAIDLPADRSSLVQHLGDSLGLQDTSSYLFIACSGRPARCQFPCRHQTLFQQQFLETGQPVFVIGMLQVVSGC